MSKRSKLRAEFYKETLHTWKESDLKYVKWLEDKINNEPSKRELLIAFFIHFRDNGEKNIGISIEKFIDNFLEDYVL